VRFETVKLLNEKTLKECLMRLLPLIRMIRCNFLIRAAEDLWSIDRKQIINKHISEILPAKHAELGENYMGNYFQYGDDTLLHTRTEVFIVDKYGDPISVLLTLSEAQIW
jgi:hypothetical protein